MSNTVSGLSFIHICVFIFLRLYFANGDVSYTIAEEMKSGSVVGNIASDLGLGISTLSSRKARIDTDRDDKRYFDINLSNGDLIVTQRIDRESLCDKKSTCVLKEELILENPLEIQRISIQVQDINDNAPEFSEGLISFEIRESAIKGAKFLLSEARDADIGTNAVQRYIVQHNEHFTININTEVPGRKQGELVLVKELDREQQSEIKLVLTALDGGTPQRSGTAVIVVTVLDANDNTPVFSKPILYPAPEGSSFMTELVPKAAHKGTLVSKVIAVDADSGQNAWLSYHIVKATDPGLFVIDVHSGEIRTQRDLLESDSMKQNLIVAVKDNGQPSLSATCSMYLLISDNLAEVPELKDISYDEKNSKLTSYLITALVSVSTFFLTFIIIILGLRFCRRRKPRLLFDGAVAIPGAYLPPNYADVDGTGTLRSAYNYDTYLTTGSRTSDFKFISSYNDNTLPADQTLKKSPSDFTDIVGGCDYSPEVGTFTK
uniref:Protocadherin beta-15-like n=1 Tax=Cyprinodon variegatus TaxID=28743 RepID=A0A3Q2CTF4_CYPVA